MIFQKLYKDKGIIVMEIMLAITIASIFVFLITEVTLLTEKVFDASYSKSLYMADYESGGLYPVESEFGNNGKILFYKDIEFSYVENNDLCSPYVYNSRVVGSYDYINSRDKMFGPSNVGDKITYIKPIQFPITDGNIITDVEVRNNIVYISTNSNIYSDHDIFVFDIQNRDNPLLLSSLNTGPGVSAMKVVDNRIYIANASTQNQLQIIGINSPVSVDVLSTYSVVQPYATATRPYASSIDVSGDHVFLGTEKWEGDELFVLDISDMSEIKNISSFDINSKVNDIFYLDEKLFVSASAYEQAILFENIGEWIQTSSFSPKGWSRQEGSKMYFFEKDLFFGRTSGGFDIKQDHEGFMWKDFSDRFDNKYLSINMEKGIYGSYVDKDFVYIVSDESLVISDKELSTTTSLSIQLPVRINNMKCYNNKLYLIANNFPIIYEIYFE